MKRKKNYQIVPKFYFKRWTNKPFAIFNSIKKIIIILTLPFIYVNAMGQDTLNIEQCIVDGMMPLNYYDNNFKLIKYISSDEIQKAGVSGLAELLKFSASVDIRQRGMSDVQADVSLRGGNFDQVLILLNGIPVSDHQTGHYSLNLPVGIEQIERIEILRGPGQSQAGFNAYAGAINIITKKSNSSNLVFKDDFGQFGYRNSNLDLNLVQNNFFSSISIGQTTSDGYTENTDFKINRIFYNSFFTNKRSIVNFQTGFLSKGFGAYNFYTPVFPYQYDKLNTELASLKIIFRKSAFTHTLKLYGRRNQDKFELFREDANWYEHIGDFWIKNNTDTAKYVQNLYIPQVYYNGHNYHETYTAGANFSTNYKNFIFALNYSYFLINSNVLGDQAIYKKVPFEKNAIFTKRGEMQNISFSISDNITLDDLFNVAVAASVNYNSKFRFFYTFSVENSLKLNNYRIYALVNQGVRLPTFTDLYYQGPSNTGNPDLKPEKNTNYEIGFNFSKSMLDIDADVFYRNGKNTIDWVRKADTDKWTPMNYTELNTLGFEFSSKIQMNKFIKFVKNISLNYTFLHQTKNSYEYLSKYVLDYPIHSFSFNFVISPIKNMALSSSFIYRKRAGSMFVYDASGKPKETFFPDYSLLNLKLEYEYKNVKFYISAENVLNSNLYDISYLRLPGRWIKVGLSIPISIK